MQVLPRRSARSARAFFNPSRVCLLALLLPALALRLFHLGAMSIWWDESLSYVRAGSDLATILAGTIQIQNVLTRDLHPPLYFLLLHFAILAFGITEFALRVLSTFANVLTVALLYPVVQLLARLGQIRHGTRIALVAALFATLSPFYVWYSQEARPYALVLFWSVLAVYALLKMVEAGKRQRRDASPASSRRDRSPYRYALLYLPALAPTLATHYLSFLLLPFHAAALVIWGGKERRWRPVALLLVLACLATFALLPASAAQLTGSDYGSAQYVPFFVILRDLLNSFVVGVTANLDDVAGLELLLLAFWCVGVASTIRPRRRDSRLALFLLAYLLVSPLALEAGSYLRPLYMNSRHLIAVSPAFYIGLAFAVEACAERVRGRQWGAARYALAAAGVSALFIYGAGYALGNLYFNPKYAKDDHRAWAQFLRERMQPGDLLILDAPQAETVYRYYAPAGLEWISLPNIGVSHAEQERRDFSAVVNAYRSHAHIWYLELHRPVADPNNHIYNLLDRFGSWLGTSYFSGTSTQLVLHEIRGEAFAPSPPPKIEHPLSLAFGTSLQLLGYDSPAQIAAGAHSSVKLYWRLLRPTGEDYGVSLRVVDDGGRRWGQWDAGPTGDQFTVSQWQAGPIMLDTHFLPLEPGTPPGVYHLEVSAYHASNHEPLGPDETARLGDITVTRPATPLKPDDLVLDHHTPVPFANGVDLVGYNAEDSSSRPGDTMPLTLYFQLRANPGHDVTGSVALSPPFWALWNPVRATAPFKLEVAGRQPGDMVQAGVLLRVPAEASGGDYDLQLALDGTPASEGLFPGTQIDFGTAVVEPITRSTAGAEITRPKQARLGDAVEFLGYNLSASSPLRVGDSVRLTLFWRALKPTNTSFTVFTHLLDSGEHVLGQNDSIPVDGSRATTSWAPGEVIADTHEFAISAGATPGNYTFEIGMYDAANGKRLPVTENEGPATGDRILLETLTLQ